MRVHTERYQAQQWRLASLEIHVHISWVEKHKGTLSLPGVESKSVGVDQELVEFNTFIPRGYAKIRYGHVEFLALSNYLCV